MNSGFWEEYARLLRAAMLNPSDKQMQKELWVFEFENGKKLDRHWRRWQRRTP